MHPHTDHAAPTLRACRRWAAHAALVASLALAAGCATGRSLRAGERAEQLQEYDRAIIEYTKVLRARPDDAAARQALDRAKLRSAQDHFARGRRLNATGRLDEALLELQLASELNPADSAIDTALRDTRAQLRTKVAVASQGKTRLESLIERSRGFAPEGLDLPHGAVLPDSLIFRDASSRDVLTAIARFAGINLVFDPQFRAAPLTIDLRNSSLDAALTAIGTATQSFYRVTAPNTVTFIPDTAAKRREYEQEIVRTFYLSNADLKETIDLLRIVVDARRVAAVPSTNAITIKDTPERVAAASRIITAIDKARPEVVIDVELLEVDRTRLAEYGLQLASPGGEAAGPSPGINGAASVNRDGLTLRDLRNLTQSDVFLTNLPALFYRVLKQDGNTRTLANPQMRTADGVSAQARFGEKVPVPVTVFSPLAAGGVAQQPITSFNYENIGVNIDITPRMHHDDEVSLALKVEVSSISGTGFGGLPTFSNRAINTVIRLKDGETNLLAGLIRDEERLVVDGIPGLSDIPVIGRIFTHSRKEAQQTDIILTLTPHIVRVLDLSEEDLRPFNVGSDTGPGSGVGVAPSPLLPQAPPRDPIGPPLPEDQPLPPEPGASQATPIRPPR